MKTLRLLGVVALALGGLWLTVAFASQDKGKDAKAKPASAPTDDMMAKWGAFATPGPEHKVLDAFVGKWTTHMKMWMDPAATPEESDGACEIKWIMGGRYIEENFKGTAMGQPFEGRGTDGYDNLKKKYVSTWIDNMGTGIMESEGTYDAAKKTFTFASMGPDPTMTKYVPMRLVYTIADANSFKLEMFGPDPSGKEHRSMELAYTRAK